MNSKPVFEYTTGEENVYSKESTVLLTAPLSLKMNRVEGHTVTIQDHVRLDQPPEQ